MLVLAITLIFMGVFFFYVRQKLVSFENRLELLSQTIQTMAGVTRAALQEDDSVEESEDSDEDEETDNELQLDYEEPELYPERVTVSDDDVKKISLPENEILEELEVKKVQPEEMEVKKVQLEEMEDKNDEVKKLTLTSLDEVKTELDTLTLKELKDKVAELNGPKLKTKKELIEFIQNKI